MEVHVFPVHMICFVHTGNKEKEVIGQVSAI